MEAFLFFYFLFLTVLGEVFGMVQRHLLAESRVHLHECSLDTGYTDRNFLPYKFLTVFKTRLCPHSETVERVDVDSGHEQVLKCEVKSSWSRTLEHPCKEQSRRGPEAEPCPCVP